MVALTVSLSACGSPSTDLDQRLGAVDQAIVDEDYELARDEVTGLLEEAAQADLEPSDEDAITSAGTALLKQIDAAQEGANTPAPEPTPEPSPSESTQSPPSGAEDPEEDEKEQEKADEEAEKEREKAEKEQEKADKEAEKEREKAEKETEKEKDEKG
ncbi:hypothetical protein GCM10027020_25130 [Nocardioides salsibiostraticola]